MLKTLCLIYLTFSALALPVPKHTGPVIDQADILSSGERNKLSQYLLSLYNNGAGPQLQILTIDSLQDEALETYSIKVVDQWKLGDEKRDDGVLFLVSLKDRKMRIEVGQGLEGTLTDYASHKVIANVKPHFKNGDYYKGIATGTSLITQIISGDINPKSIKSKPRSSGFNFNIIFLFIFLLLSFLGRGRRRSRGIYYSGSGFGSSGGGFGGGGGFSGGGGGFSGGGSSGSW